MIPKIRIERVKNIIDLTLELEKCNEEIWIDRLPEKRDKKWFRLFEKRTLRIPGTLGGIGLKRNLSKILIRTSLISFVKSG
ncbi:hypothetical protein Cdeb_00009 [Caldibacillus debilis GB1]|jgi:hypothetical protein|uniref:Uncharacterized protein n=1 Tax=Caldibacillus debilis GB1 TaxID=1339248 RepID=A0A420VHR9_9BACI|nr:hypothetical protein Cdeb_00009 [Caldibacillus debilis GB1]